MKKILGLTLGLSLLTPLVAIADSIGVGTMQIEGSSPDVAVTLNNKTYVWAGDYDVKSSNLGDLTLESTEVFCVENADLISTSTNYAFYRIDGELNTNYSGGDATYLAMLTEATWLANWGLTQASEDGKAIAQLAIWKVMFGASPTNYFSYWTKWKYESQVNDLLAEYGTANNKTEYVDEWLLAVSPDVTSGEIKLGVNGQNFLVKASSPVPEPSTMLLFGTGVAGLAGMIRRKKN